MIVIRLFTPLSFILQVQIWMQLTVLMLLLETRGTRALAHAQRFVDLWKLILFI